jgi:hypothetical protein
LLVAQIFCATLERNFEHNAPHPQIRRLI